MTFPSKLKTNETTMDTAAGQQLSLHDFFPAPVHSRLFHSRPLFGAELE